jgi:hypothetical protein
MGTFGKSWNEFNEYEMPKNIFYKKNVFYCLKDFQKDSKWFENVIFMCTFTL